MCVILYAKKGKYLNEISHKKISSGLPVLGTQIRCAQNWYTAVQMDIKYPMYIMDQEIHAESMKII